MNGKEFFSGIFRGILDAAFPAHCLGCGAALPNGDVACAACIARIERFKTLFCAECGARLPEQKKICHSEMPYTLGAAADYHNPLVRELVHALKFKFVKRAARPLADLLSDYAELAALRLEGYAVIPVPLSRARERQRGFNQAELIAKLFAARLRLELAPDILFRQRHARPQSELNDFSKRQENVMNAFSVPHPELARSKNFILIDDVTTSGATFFEAASALKRAGVKKIICFAAAKS